MSYFLNLQGQNNLFNDVLFIDKEKLYISGHYLKKIWRLNSGIQ